MHQPLPPLQIRGPFGDLDESWKAIAVGFLVEKARRTGSRRTTEVYGRTVGRFLRDIGDPAVAKPLDVHRFAYGLGADGRPPAPSTVCVRLAAVSGFYDFACRMEALARNPASKVRRPQTRQAPPRGLSLAEVARLLAFTPGTPTGLRDRAMIVTALLTGLRRSELVDLRLADPVPGAPAHYEVRTKGGGLRRRELPEPAWQAILVARGAMGAPLVPGISQVFPISDTTFYGHLRRYGEAAGLGRVSPHVLRHTAAKLRRGAGATIEDVSRLLGHRSIGTTATYLRRLEDERDDGWAPVASALGLSGPDPGSSHPADRPEAGSHERSRADQEVRQGGCLNSRPVTWRGAQANAPLPRRNPSPAPEPGRDSSGGAAKRRSRRRRPARSRRTRPGGELSALRRAP